MKLKTSNLFLITILLLGMTSWSDDQDIQLTSENHNPSPNTLPKDIIKDQSYSVNALSNEPDFYELIDYTLTPLVTGYQFDATIKNNGDPATTGLVPISWESFGYTLELTNGVGTLFESALPLDLNGDGDQLDSFEVIWAPNDTRPCDAIVDGMYVYAIADHSENRRYNRSYYLDGKSKLFQIGNETHVLYDADMDSAYFGFGDAEIKLHPSPNLEFVWYADITASDFKINGISVQANHTWKGLEKFPNEEIYNYTVYVIPNQASEIVTGEELTFSCNLIPQEAISPSVAVLMNWSPDSITRYTWIPFGHELSSPSLTFPREGKIVTGDVNITWAPAVDNWGHDLNYNVYYSNDRGTTWMTLANGLTATNYVWNSTTVPDGIDYMIKVNATCEKGFFTETTIKGTFIIRTYKSQGIITINSDAELNSSFPGIGTFDDPIRIENISINSTIEPLISISFTTFYFHIADNLLNGMSTAWTGIKFQNVGNGTIANNTIYGCGRGIALAASSNNTIINNSLYNNYHSGISITNSQNNTLSTNIASNNVRGIVMVSSSNNTINNNTVYDHTNRGIHLGYSMNNTVRSNIVYNSVIGIVFWQSPNNSIIGNNLTNNHFGIFTPSTVPVPGIIEDCIQGSVVNNIVNGKPLVYWENIIGGTIPSGAGQVILVNCSDVTVKNQNLESGGIILDFCFNVTLYNNTLEGITLLQSDNNTLIKNSGFNNKGMSIILFGYCNNNILSNNSVGKNVNQGITINWNSRNNTITNNTVFNSIECGVLVEDSENNSISHNIFLSNQKYGIIIQESSNDTKIQFNEFTGNNIGGSQAVDNGSNNDFSFNYWSDWTGTGSYAIDGTAGNEDLSPLTNSNHLSEPVITYPTSDTLPLKNSVTIQWTASSDSWGHQITHLVYYSADGGTTWTVLDTVLIKTNYEWDTTTVPDGSSFMVKVIAVCSLGLKVYSLSPSSITIDNTPPTLTIPSPLNQTYTTNVITIILSGDAAHYWYYIETVDTQNKTWTTDETRTLTDGAYTLHAYGNDSAGNIVYVLRDFSIDTILPTITIDSPLNQTYTTDTVTIALSGDVAHYWYYIDSVDTQNRTWTSNVTRTITDGDYTLHAYGNDSAGNIAHVSITFTIETAVPTGSAAPTLSSPANGTTLTTTTATLQWTLVTDAVEYQVQVDTSSSFTSIVFEVIDTLTTVTTSTLGNNDYAWRVRAKDALGNWGTWSDVGYFTIEATPVTTITIETTPVTTITTVQISSPSWTPLIVLISLTALLIFRKRMKPPLR
jgi:parallel beta-helix repeat protein